jgi:hypothetical protein
MTMRWPRTAVSNASPPFQRFAGRFPAAGGIRGGGYYLLVQRHRNGVLAEHRADGLTPSVPPSVTPLTHRTTPETAG